jgi:hypothetical protein
MGLAALWLDHAPAGSKLPRKRKPCAHAPWKKTRYLGPVGLKEASSGWTVPDGASQTVNYFSKHGQLSNLRYRDLNKVKLRSGRFDIIQTGCIASLPRAPAAFQEHKILQGAPESI